MNKARLFYIYLILIHVLLVVVLIKSDFLDRALVMIGFQNVTTEHTPYHYRIFEYHKRIDKNLPDKSIILIGDSHIQGLAVSAVSPFAVNYGIGSDTTMGVIQRLPGYKSVLHAKVVILAIGVNDLWVRPNKDIVINYNTILDMLPEDVPVIVNAIFPVDEKLLKYSSGFNKRIVELNSSLHNLATKYSNLIFLDAHALLTDQTGSLSDEYHIGDGIHLNQKGYKLWINSLKQIVSKL